MQSVVVASAPVTHTQAPVGGAGASNAQGGSPRTRKEAFVSSNSNEDVTRTDSKSGGRYVFTFVPLPPPSHHSVHIWRCSQWVVGGLGGRK